MAHHYIGTSDDKFPIALGTPVRRTDPSQAPPVPEPEPEPILTGIPYRGIIQVRRLSDDAVLGYVSVHQIGANSYQPQDIFRALVVNF